MLFLNSTRLLFVGLAVAAWPAMAHANIGDTLDELRARYGSAKDMGSQMLFEVRLKNGQIVPARGAADVETHLTVNVYFDGTHSAMEIFTRNTSDPAKMEMSQGDIDTILAATDGGMKWVRVELNGKPGWVRSDDKLIARFRPNATGSASDASVLMIMANIK